MNPSNTSLLTFYFIICILLDLFRDTQANKKPHVFAIYTSNFSFASANRNTDASTLGFETPTSKSHSEHLLFTDIKSRSLQMACYLEAHPQRSPRIKQPSILTIPTTAQPQRRELCPRTSME